MEQSWGSIGVTLGDRSVFMGGGSSRKGLSSRGGGREHPGRGHGPGPSRTVVRLVGPVASGQANCPPSPGLGTAEGTAPGPCPR